MNTPFINKKPSTTNCFFGTAPASSCGTSHQHFVLRTSWISILTQAYAFFCSNIYHALYQSRVLLLPPSTTATNATTTTTPSKDTKASTATENKTRAIHVQGEEENDDDSVPMLMICAETQEESDVHSVDTHDTDEHHSHPFSTTKQTSSLTTESTTTNAESEATQEVSCKAIVLCPQQQPRNAMTSVVYTFFLVLFMFACLNYLFVGKIQTNNVDHVEMVTECHKETAPVLDLGVAGLSPLSVYHL